MRTRGSEAHALEAAAGQSQRRTRRGPRMRQRAACAREPAARWPAGGGRPKAESASGGRACVPRRVARQEGRRRSGARRPHADALGALLPRVGASGGLQVARPIAAAG